MATSGPALRAGAGPGSKEFPVSVHPLSTTPPTIVPREKLDFGLDGDIPKYWFGDDAFKTRYFDSMSTTFPEGERYFICCVRDFRDQVSDERLRQEIKDFIRQEGQHGIVHSRFNDLLKAQGIDVDRLEGFTRTFLFDIMRRFFPRKHTLATTAACEHLTAIMAHSFFQRSDVMASADPRMMALYAWHAMEEMEHKAVAFDVMQKVAKVGYLRRIYTLFEVTIAFNLQMLIYTNIMLKTDGHSLWARTKMFAKGLWWLYGARGLYMSNLKPYLRYYKPGFHPWQETEPSCYQLWVDTFNRTG